MSKRIAVVSGSFDPVTRGHADIIRRASRLFDEVVVSVNVNNEKGGGMYTADERLEMVKCATEGIENVKVSICEGLLSDFVIQCGARYLVRGVRNASDFDYEYSLAEIMRQFDGRIETVFLPALPELAHISSTYAKERIRYGCDLSDVADEKTAKLMREYYK